MKNITKNKIFLITFCTLLGFSIPIFKDFQGKIDTKSPPNLSLGPEIHAMTNISGMYITHNLFDYNIAMYSSNISYTYNSGSIYDVLWTGTFGGDTWQVNTSTREIIGSSSIYFSDFTHTPFWIFTDVSLSDTILISSIWDVDHTFEISDELVYNLTSFGLIEVWVLQDL